MQHSTERYIKGLPQGHPLNAVASITSTLFIILVIISAFKQLAGQIASFHHDVRRAADSGL